MKTIKTFDEATVKEIQARAFELLAPLQAEFGVTFGEAGKGFGRYYCTVFFKMNVPPEEGDLELDTPAARQFRKYAPQHGIPAELLGKEFTAAGNKYRLLGYKKSAVNQFLLQSGAEECRVPEVFVKQLLAEAGLWTGEDVGTRSIQWGSPAASTRVQ